jgi:hypothetical protein
MGGEVLDSSTKCYIVFGPDGCEVFAVVALPDFVEENILMSSDGLSIPQPNIRTATREIPAASDLETIRTYHYHRLQAERSYYKSHGLLSENDHESFE